MPQNRRVALADVCVVVVVVLAAVCVGDDWVAVELVCAVTVAVRDDCVVVVVAVSLVVDVSGWDAVVCAVVVVASVAAAFAAWSESAAAVVASSASVDVRGRGINIFCEMTRGLRETFPDRVVG